MAPKQEVRRSPTLAALWGAPIGLLGGLIGLGGAEFRLPVLTGVFGYTARRAVALNLAISLVTVVSALVIRGGTLSLAPLLGLLPVVVAMIVGAVSAAYVGTALVHRVSEHLLERIILVFLVVIGHRPDLDDEARREAALVDERIQLVAAKAVRRGDPERLGRYVAERLEAQAGRNWVHFDVFDEGEMPAVTYPQPDGLSWDEVESLLRPLLSSPALVGLSVADFVPDKDPDGSHARRLVDLAVGALT